MRLNTLTKPKDFAKAADFAKTMTPVKRESKNLSQSKKIIEPETASKVRDASPSLHDAKGGLTATESEVSKSTHK